MDTRNGATTSPTGSTPSSSNPTASAQKSSRSITEILMDETPLMTVEDKARWAALAAKRKAEKQKSSRSITEILMDESPLVVVSSEEERQVWEERFRRADEKAAHLLELLEKQNNTR